MSCVIVIKSSFMLHFLLHHQLFAQWFDDNNAFICGHCTALTNWLLPASWEPGSLPHFWWTLWKKNICVRKTFTETTAELQTLWWILLLFQFSSHYSYSSIGLLPHLLFIIIWRKVHSTGVDTIVICDQSTRDFFLPIIRGWKQSSVPYLQWC